MSEARLDGELDRLYGLPLAEFTKERDALARRLRDEGDRDGAASVSELRKPVLSAWVVNQLARQRPDDVKALVAAAGEIRTGTVGSDERFRGAADTLVQAARALIEADGRRPTDAVLRDVATTLRSAAAGDAALLTGGRLTEPLEATGFEAMAGAAPRRRPRARETPERAKRADRARVEEARKAVADARDEARRLGREANAAEREARRLRDAAEAADRRLADAEQALAKLRG